MKSLFAGAVLLIAPSLMPSAAQNPVMTAKVSRASLGEALERAYSRESTYAQENPPHTLGDVHQIALDWRVLSGKPFPARRKRGASIADGPLTITIQKMDSDDQRAVATVIKRYEETFYYRPNKPSTVKSEATFKHVWMNAGAEWLIMTSTLEKAYMKMDGKAFTPDRKLFNPNNSFRAPTPLNPIGPRDDTPH